MNRRSNGIFAGRVIFSMLSAGKSREERKRKEEKEKEKKKGGERRKIRENCYTKQKGKHYDCKV
jgi:hypothetical protein